MQVGDRVKLKTTMLGNIAGTIGYVYEQYADFDNPSKSGVSVIFENGEYDGFSYNEQQIFLEFLEPTNVYYHFKNVMKLSQDFNNGQFEFVWRLHE